MARARRTLPPEALQRLLLDRLAHDWREANERHVDGQLRPPIFALAPPSGRLGSWQAASRTLSISLTHASDDPWVEVRLTLLHEMAHQAVSELFGADGARPHGALFQRAAALLGIDGSPRRDAAPEPASARVIERVRKLMALGRSSSDHEASAALGKAHEILLRHNLDLVDAAGGGGAIVYRHLGPPVGRIGLDRKLISGILADHFFVQPLWLCSEVMSTGRAARLLEVSGRPHNVELASYVHDYLLRTLDTLWVEHRTANPAMPRPRARRHDFRAGVLLGFREHLSAQRAHHDQTGLVWVGDPAVADDLRRRHPHVSTMRGGRYRLGATHDAGRAQGRRLRIRPGVGGTASRGRALER